MFSQDNQSLHETEELESRIHRLEKDFENLQKRNEELLKNYLESQELASFGNWEYQISTGNVTWSDNLFKIFGKDPALFKPTLEDLYSIIHPEDRNKIKNIIESAIASGIAYSSDYRIIVNGEIRHIHSKGRPVTDRKGNMVRLIGTSQDITDRKNIEKALEESEYKFNKSFHTNPALLSISRLQDGLLVEANQAFFNGIGYTREELIGHSITEFNIYAKGFDRREIVDQVKKYGRIRNIEIPAWDKNGNSKTFLASGEIISINNEDHILFSAIDITEKKQTEEVINRKNRVFQAINLILEAILSSNSEVELGQRCLHISENITESQFGFIGEIRGDVMIDVAISNPGWDACTIPDADQGKILSFHIQGFYGEVLKTGQSMILEQPSKHPAAIGLPEGHPGIINFMGVPLKHQGQTIGMVALANREGGFTLAQKEDMEALAPAIVAVFQRKRAETNTSRLAGIIETSSQPAGFTRPDGSISYINEALEKLSGYTKEEFSRMTWMDVTPPEYLDKELSDMETMVRTGIPLKYEKEFIRKDGSRVPVQLLVHLMRDKQGKPEYFYTFINDISDRKKYEKSLEEENEKLEKMVQERTVLLTRAMQDLETERQYVMTRVMETEELDRRRFASDLHDDLGPTLSSIKLQLGMLETEKEENSRKELVDICEKLLSDAIEKMRTIANNLRPSLLEKFGLETAMRSFLDRISINNRLNIIFTSNLEQYRFDDQTELHLYRIVTELINNSLKHSGGDTICLEYTLTPSEFSMRYWDSGPGYSIHALPEKSSGIGLQNIRHRVNLINGTLSFIHTPGRTEVLIKKQINPAFPL